MSIGPPRSFQGKCVILQDDDFSSLYYTLILLKDLLGIGGRQSRRGARYRKRSQAKKGISNSAESDYYNMNHAACISAKHLTFRLPFKIMLVFAKKSFFFQNQKVFSFVKI